MGEISLPVLFNFTVFLALPFICGYLAIRAKLPPIIGYILGGVILGVFFGKIVSEEFLSHFAGLGIILLLFTVGLEMNVDALKRFGRFAIFGGLMQVIITAMVLVVLSLLFGFSLVSSLFIGLPFALSSTTVVAKIIQDRGEESSLYGGLALGVLIFQDLAAIPLIIVASFLGDKGSVFQVIINLLLGTLKAGGVLLLMYILGKKLVPYFFSKTARASREILNLFTIFFIFAIVYIFSFMGVPASVAAFISGVLIGQTLEHYHIFSQIRPLRDLFAIFFFVYLGASIKVGLLYPLIFKIIAFSAILIAAKFAVVLVIFLFFRFHSRTSFSLALSLSQVGEFAFIILNVGVLNQLVSDEVYLFAATSMLLTIVTTPLLIANKDNLYLTIKKLVKKYIPTLAHYISHSIDCEPPHLQALPIKNHVVICGFGRVGSYIGRALSLADIPFVAVDYNFYAVEKAKRHGVNIIYGDPTNIEILDYAECESAVCLVSAVPEKFAQEMIILNAKRLNPKIMIFTRVEREGDQRRMKDLGAEVVVQPEFEAALSIIKKIFVELELPKEQIISKVKRLQLEYGMR